MTDCNTPDNRSLAISDLDGTLLLQHSFRRQDLTTMVRLAELRIPRVIATGRSLFSARRVLDDDFPIDYLVFSAGAGVMDWRKQQLMRQREIPPELVTRAIRLLQELELDFMVHAPIPDNHRFHWHSAGNDNPDFDRRLELYRGYTEQLQDDTPGAACQLIAISPVLPPEAVWSELRERLAPLEVVRATSPLDDCSTWLELYPPETTKSTACSWLAEQLGVAQENSLALGNDYNDLDLLRWAGQAFLVDGAPAELQQEFEAVQDGWQEAVERWLGKNAEYSNRTDDV